MAMSQAAYAAEKAIGHGDGAVTEQDITNPALDRAKYADPSGETMKALVWMGKNKVEVRKWNQTKQEHPPVFPSGVLIREMIEEVPKPRVVEPRDVILQVTGSTVCGSDLHLLHGKMP